jgi:uncharacterized peroxidase-related enzyme
VTADGELAAALRRDHTTADLSEADRAMLDFAVKLTAAPHTHTRADVERLRAVGFDDTGILQITLIAAFFNYINRVADGLGVGRPDPA